MTLEVVVADTSPVARRSLSRMVRGWGWHVVAEATDGLEAVRLARELEPDLLIVDVSRGSRGWTPLYDLLESAGPLVVRLIDRPQDHASGAGVAVLKGVPADRVRAVILDALERRTGFGTEE